MNRRVAVRRGALPGVVAKVPAGVIPTGAPWLPNFSLGRVQWSLAFLAFLGYTIAITSARLPIGTAAMATALITLALERGGIRASSVAVWAVALFAWAFTTMPMSDYHQVVADNVIELAKVCAVAFVAINVIRTRDRLRIFLVVYLGTFALYPVRGALVSYFFLGGAVGGRAAWNFIYSNPNDLAGFCLLHMSLVAGVVATERKAWVNLAAKIGMGVLPFLIILTGSRGGFVGLLAFVLLAFWRKIANLKAVVSIALVATVIVLFIPDTIWRRLGTIKDVDQASTTSTVGDESSTAQRLEIWRVAATITAEHPVIGVGLGAYPNAHYEYSRRPEFDQTIHGHKDAHSTFLRLSAELGLVGFGLFIGLVVATLRDAERTRRRRAQTHPREAAQLFYMEIGFIAYLVAGIWASWGTLAFTYVQLGVIHAASRLLQDDAAPARRQVMRGIRHFRSATPVQRSPA